MNWKPIAKKEFRAFRRIKTNWILGILLFFYSFNRIVSPEPFIKQVLGGRLAFGAFQQPIGLLIPIAAIVVSYRSIAGQRRSGSIKFDAGFPQTRADILIGKILGQTAALSLPVLGVLLIGGVLGTLIYGGFSLLVFSGFLAATLLYVLLSVAIANGVSALVSQPPRAVGIMLGYLLIFLIMWQNVRNILYSFVTGNELNALNPPPVQWIFLFDRLAPHSSYFLVTNAILGVKNSSSQYFSVIASGESRISTTALIYGGTFSGPPPFYLTPEFGLIIMALWICLIPAIGYLGFRRADLS